MFNFRYRKEIGSVQIVVQRNHDEANGDDDILFETMTRKTKRKRRIMMRKKIQRKRANPRRKVKVLKVYLALAGTFSKLISREMGKGRVVP